MAPLSAGQMGQSVKCRLYYFARWFWRRWLGGKLPFYHAFYCDALVALGKPIVGMCMPPAAGRKSRDQSPVAAMSTRQSGLGREGGGGQVNLLLMWMTVGPVRGGNKDDDRVLVKIVHHFHIS